MLTVTRIRPTSPRNWIWVPACNFWEESDCYNLNNHLTRGNRSNSGQTKHRSRSRATGKTVSSSRVCGASWQWGVSTMEWWTFEILNGHPERRTPEWWPPRWRAVSVLIIVCAVIVTRLKRARSYCVVHYPSSTTVGLIRRYVLRHAHRSWLNEWHWTLLSLLRSSS